MLLLLLQKKKKENIYRKYCTVWFQILMLCNLKINTSFFFVRCNIRRQAIISRPRKVLSKYWICKYFVVVFFVVVFFKIFWFFRSQLITMKLMKKKLCTLPHRQNLNLFPIAFARNKLFKIYYHSSVTVSTRCCLIWFVLSFWPLYTQNNSFRA